MEDEVARAMSQIINGAMDIVIEKENIQRTFKWAAAWGLATWQGMAEMIKVPHEDMDTAQGSRRVRVI